ncbi:hypothetical protein I4U23_004638 [Adineta vaga]|nr:hypothetical protein I4U23_004638 [Adineta vaga]
MTNSRKYFQQGQLFDDYADLNVSLYVASNDDIEELCKVINWAYVGKPSKSELGELKFDWVNEKYLMQKARITLEELRELIEDEEHCIVLIAKLKTLTGLQIVGCTKIVPYDQSLQIGDDEKQDLAVEFGLNAVDPDYQSQGIGTLLYNGAIRITKEYFNAQRVYSHIISSKRNQIEWCFRQGFIETGRFIPYPRKERLYSNVDPDTVKFSVLTKRLK